LEEHRDVIRGKYACLAVDESQDLNRIQYRLLRALPVERRLFVGDPQQSIYFFRGADSRLFDEQIRQSACRILRLNHRSTGRILRAVEKALESEWGDRL
ncbi:MAG: ATP-dependent DNA helicase PcrA, partial [Armatimonadota bacterium]